MKEVYYGEKRGREAERQEGRQEGRQSLILKLLARRVGELPLEIVAQVQALDLEQLEALGEALFDFSTLTDLLDWLATHRPNREGN
ncbi:MAG: DUF4351 domain-containing protein [Leptolyngbya sp. IPPAS B-1204]|nr:DUF4351 domain-containing protein [Elainella sp. C42_A2020_010]RNJ65416.1 MAG: DUF4351 domain-containing protein [Leptolyngbya sp. IPPAS B-1204]